MAPGNSGHKIITKNPPALARRAVGTPAKTPPTLCYTSGINRPCAKPTRNAGVPPAQAQVDWAADTLQDGIERATVILDELTPATAREIARLLSISDVPQTRRMVCAIVANAFVEGYNRSVCWTSGRSLGAM